MGTKELGFRLRLGLRLEKCNSLTRATVRVRAMGRASTEIGGTGKRG